MQTVLSLVPSKYLVPAGILASANKHLIIPGAKKLASKISTGLGVLSASEAKNQERLFDEMLFPITSIIDNLEQQVIDILGGTEFGSVLSSWIGGKKKHSPTEITEKEDQAVKNEYVSAIGQNVGPQVSEASAGDIKKQMHVSGRVRPKESFTQKSSVSATNIDMSLFNAMEHENANAQHMNPNPGPALSGAPAQSLSVIAKSMQTPGSVLIPKRKRF